MSELIDELLEDAKGRMNKSVESSRGELATVRTGRASLGIAPQSIVGEPTSPPPTPGC